MEIANAGMYDGASSLAEGALMACRLTGRARVAVTETVNPHYVETVRAYAGPQDLEVYPLAPGGEIRPETACVIGQYPNFFGYVEDVRALADRAHAAGALSVLSCDPTALALFASPGALGADVATGEGQALGVPPSFGGPYVGIFTCRRAYLRQLPGRIVGRTVDAAGRPGYVLTLQPREQHIRRERATSNICTSTALVGLWATVYLALMGRRGLRAAAELCYQKAHYAADRIAALPGYGLAEEGGVLPGVRGLLPPARGGDQPGPRARGDHRGARRGLPPSERHAGVRDRGQHAGGDRPARPGPRGDGLRWRRGSPGAGRRTIGAGC